jgi:dTMP kinase
MFITFEGIEGCGKSTQIRLLADNLERCGCATTLTREPGGTKIGEAIRGIFLHCDHNDMLPATELLLVTAARAQHVGQVIKPERAAGRIVLCDRYVDATIAYQGYAAGLGSETVMRCHDMFVDGLMPDLTVLLDCSVELGLQRSRDRNCAAGCQIDEGRFEERETDFHERVRQGYLQQARCEPGRFVIISAQGTPDEIHHRILEAVLPPLRRDGYAV